MSVTSLSGLLNITTPWMGMNDESETVHSNRTRCLDNWLRELCCHYKTFTWFAQQNIDSFLNLQYVPSKSTAEVSGKNLTSGDSGGSGSGGDSSGMNNPLKVSIIKRLQTGFIEGPRSTTSSSSNSSDVRSLFKLDLSSPKQTQVCLMLCVRLLLLNSAVFLNCIMSMSVYICAC